MKKKITDVLVELCAWLMSLTLLGFIMFFMFSCSTIKQTSTEKHDVSQLTEMMDSLMKTTKIWQKDFIERQMSIFESLKEKEKNDSSYSVVVNEKGDTVKEKIVIYHEVEKERVTEKEMYEMIVQQYNRIDSLLNMSIKNQEKSDSLFKEKEKEKEVPAELNWWQKLRIILGNFVLMFAGGVVLYQIIKKRLWK